MASDSGIDSQSSPELPQSGTMSRTHQYRKVMKPMLERKRRARINKCLDELKDLMVTALQKEGETITKLEKADVLELTVRHLRKLKAQGGLQGGPCSPPGGGVTGAVEHYRAGFRVCAGEITKFVTCGGASMDLGLTARLLQHLSLCLHSLDTVSNAIPVNHPVCQPSHAASPSVETSLPGVTAVYPSLGSLPDISRLTGPAKVENSRFSQPGAVLSTARGSPSPRPWSAPASTLVKAEVTVVSMGEGEKNAWRPW